MLDALRERELAIRGLKEEAQSNGGGCSTDRLADSTS
jgi:hypothetical protein